MRPRSRRFAVIAAFTLLGPALVHAGATPAEKCIAAKQKAAAKKFASKLKCYETGTLKAAGAVDSTCLMTAETKFNAAITKAESTGGCAVTGDGGFIESTVNTCVNIISAVGALGCGPVSTCGTVNNCAGCGGIGACVGLAEGGSACIYPGPCGAPCTKSGDCPALELCVINTCCGGGTCLDVCK
jgi:hypothetical protein